MPGDGDISSTEAFERVEKPVRKFTWKELSKLNSHHNAHVAYRGKVYDVSSFIARHPGGSDQILLGAGRDITQVFETYHNYERVSRMLQEFYVGELLNSEVPVFPPRGEFYRTLKKRVNEYFEKENIDPKMSYWMFLRYVVFLSCTFLSHICTIRFHDSWILGMFFAISWGFFQYMITITVCHDASHYTITHNPWVWKIMGNVHDIYNGCSMLLWKYSHIMSHHAYTNIHGADPDIHTYANDVPDVRRIKAEQKWMPRYLNQHIWVPLLYCVLSLKTRLVDFSQLLNLDICGVVRLNPVPISEWLIFLVGKATHIYLHWYVPSLYMPLSTLLLYKMVEEFVGSYCLALTIETSHVVTKVEWPKVDENNVINKDWAELQIATTQDFATDSWFWTVFTGGLNHQTAHHLFPNIGQFQYMKITPIIKKTCKDFGMEYHSVATAREAYQSHFDYLRIMGQEKLE